MDPVRCFTCGKVISYNHPEKMTRWCCKRMILSRVAYLKKILKYDEVKSETIKE